MRRPATGGFDVSPGASARPSDGTWLPGVSDGACWQLVTAMFTHVELLHIGFNMLALWVLGPQLELVLGRARFLGALPALRAGRARRSSTGSPGEYTPTLGASGAIFGLMGALLVVASRCAPTCSQLLIWIGINFVFTFFGRSAISWQGHLGGFVGGARRWPRSSSTPRAQRRTAWQAAGFARPSRVLVVARPSSTRTAVAHLSGCPRLGTNLGRTTRRVILHR